MIIEMYNGYKIWETNSGGRAGKGLNATASIQVRNKENRVLKSVRYALDVIGGRRRAVQLAKVFVDKMIDNPHKYE